MEVISIHEFNGSDFHSWKSMEVISIDGNQWKSFPLMEINGRHFH
jgi:hypothetical protein